VTFKSARRSRTFSKSGCVRRQGSLPPEKVSSLLDTPFFSDPAGALFLLFHPAFPFFGTSCFFAFTLPLHKIMFYLNMNEHRYTTCSTVSAGLAGAGNLREMVKDISGGCKQL
jgi:hypothetical protein